MKQLWEKRKIEELEESYKNSRSFFRIANEIKSTFQPKAKMMKNSNNQIFSGEEVIVTEFKNICQELQNYLDRYDIYSSVEQKMETPSSIYV